MAYLANSLFYFASCKGLKEPSQLAKQFVDKGAKVVVGYDETNEIGSFTGAALLQNLSEINDLNSTIAKLPQSAKYESEYGVNLVSWGQ